jgi:hypothetical protein
MITITAPEPIGATGILIIVFIIIGTIALGAFMEWLRHGRR